MSGGSSGVEGFFPILKNPAYLPVIIAFIILKGKNIRGKGKDNCGAWLSFC